jgi:hypothetical protein
MDRADRNTTLRNPIEYQRRAKSSTKAHQLRRCLKTAFFATDLRPIPWHISLMPTYEASMRLRSPPGSAPQLDIDDGSNKQAEDARQIDNRVDAGNSIYGNACFREQQR